jgi:hypothetical protein
MGSGDRLQNAIKDNTQTLKLLVSTLALLHIQLRPANPAERAPERPNSRWKTLDLLFLTERGEGHYLLKSVVIPNV